MQCLSGCLPFCLSCWIYLCTAYMSVWVWVCVYEYHWVSIIIKIITIIIVALSPSSSSSVFFVFFFVVVVSRPCGLTFLWWGCYSLCHRHKLTKLAHSFFLFFCSCVCFCVYALSTLFHSIISPDNSSLSHSVLLVLCLPYCSFQLYISLWKSPSALV